VLRCERLVLLGRVGGGSAARRRGKWRVVSKRSPAQRKTGKKVLVSSGRGRKGGKAL